MSFEIKFSFEISTLSRVFVQWYKIVYKSKLFQVPHMKYANNAANRVWARLNSQSQIFFIYVTKILVEF